MQTEALRVRHPQGQRGDAQAVQPGQHRARLSDVGATGLNAASGRCRRPDGAGLQKADCVRAADDFGFKAVESRSTCTA
jgi:hypothetical protein